MYMSRIGHMTVLLKVLYVLRLHPPPSGILQDEILTMRIMAYTLHTIYWEHLQIAELNCNMALILWKIAMEAQLLLALLGKCPCFSRVLDTLG